MNTKKIDPRFKAVIDRIIKATTPILEESLVNEISSTLYYDAADAARSYNGGQELANRFQSRAQEVEADELTNRTDDFYEEIEDFNIADKHFIIAKYIPTNIYVLVMFKGSNEKSDVVIARIAREKIVPISNESIIADIASVYNLSKNPISRALDSFAKAFTPSRSKNKTAENARIEKKNAKELATKINTAVGANVSWRYFFDDRTSTTTVHKTSKKDMYFTFGNPTTVAVDGVDDKVFVACLGYGKNRDMYTLFYFYLSDGEHNSFVQVKRLESGFVINGYKQTDPIYDRLEEEYPDTMKNYSRPYTKTDSNIMYVYNWLRELDPRLIKALMVSMTNILRYDSRFSDDTLTWKDFVKAYRVAALDASTKIKDAKADADNSDVVASAPQGDSDDEDVDDD